jgi:hypothetical protein
MTNRGIDIKHPQQRGEWAELRFMARAAEQGVCSTNPWGEMAHRLCHRASGTLPARAGQVDQAQTQTLLSLQRARLERTLWRQPDRLRRRLAKACCETPIFNLAVESR